MIPSAATALPPPVARLQSSDRIACISPATQDDRDRDGQHRAKKRSGKLPQHALPAWCVVGGDRDPDQILVQAPLHRDREEQHRDHRRNHAVERHIERRRRTDG